MLRISPCIGSIAGNAIRCFSVAVPRRDGLLLLNEPVKSDAGDFALDPPGSVWVHPSWIIENSSNHLHATGQRTSTLEDLASNSGRVVACQIDPKTGDLTASLTTAGEGLGDANEVAKKSDTAPREVTVKVALKQLLAANPFAIAPQFTASKKLHAIRSETELKRLKFTDVTPKNKQLFAALANDGIVLIEGCPVEENVNAVSQLAKILAPVSGMMKTLYGEDFKVDRVPTSEGPRNNIAYTGEYLDLHNDICYYESMPGLQLLLCRAFDAKVTGGESFFVDAFGAAEELRKVRPDAFETLTRIPCPLQKIDPKREVPANYYFGAPHITTNPITGAVTKVIWSPAFEGVVPLWYGEGTSRQYYDAKRAFAEVLREWRTTHAVRFRLQPGQCVVFNQQRVLHGRESFSEPKPGMRKLHGCYVNIDDFASSCRVALGHEMPQVPLGNGSQL